MLLPRYTYYVFKRLIKLSNENAHLIVVNTNTKFEGMMDATSIFSKASSYIYTALSPCLSETFKRYCRVSKYLDEAVMEMQPDE